MGFVCIVGGRRYRRRGKLEWSSVWFKNGWMDCRLVCRFVTEVALDYVLDFFFCFLFDLCPPLRNLVTLFSKELGKDAAG